MKATAAAPQLKRAVCQRLRRQGNIEPCIDAYATSKSMARSENDIKRLQDQLERMAGLLEASMKENHNLKAQLESASLEKYRVRAITSEKAHLALLFTLCDEARKNIQQGVSRKDALVLIERYNARLAELVATVRTRKQYQTALKRNSDVVVTLDSVMGNTDGNNVEDQDQLFLDIVRESGIVLNGKLYEFRSTDQSGVFISALQLLLKEMLVRHDMFSDDSLRQVTADVLMASNRTVGGGDAYETAASIYGNTKHIILSPHDDEPSKIAVDVEGGRIIVQVTASYKASHFGAEEVDEFDLDSGESLLKNKPRGYRRSTARKNQTTPQRLNHPLRTNHHAPADSLCVAVWAIITATVQETLTFSSSSTSSSSSSSSPSSSLKTASSSDRRTSTRHAFLWRDSKISSSIAFHFVFTFWISIQFL